MLNKPSRAEEAFENRLFERWHGKETREGGCRKRYGTKGA